ncbi:hypothetical protein [Agromyces sp. SYSU T00194]|uniref:hypothetical protein n=1 Tax=Agromyces chitinivorans TaxID=3158560 RepID=UPI0033971BA6
MDVVYLCRPGENPELRHSLRSLVNLPHDNVWIVGDAPHWVNRNTTHVVPVPRQGSTRFGNVRRNLEKACRHPLITDPFILFNDDFYITRPTTELPLYNRGHVTDVIGELHRAGNRGPYPQAVADTAAVLEQHGHRNPLSFELHVPLLIHKAAMLDALALNPGITRWHYRTAYGAIAGLRGRTIRDVKILHPNAPFPTTLFVSTSDNTYKTHHRTLAALFPEPSPHEEHA